MSTTKMPAVRERVRAVVDAALCEHGVKTSQTGFGCIAIWITRDLAAAGLLRDGAGADALPAGLRARVVAFLRNAPAQLRMTDSDDVLIERDALLRALTAGEAAATEEPWTYRVFRSAEDRAWIATSRAFGPSLSGIGDTPEEAVRELGVAIQGAAVNVPTCWPAETPATGAPRRMRANAGCGGIGEHAVEHDESAGCAAGPPCQPVADPDLWEATRDEAYREAQTHTPKPVAAPDAAAVFRGRPPLMEPDPPTPCPHPGAVAVEWVDRPDWGTTRKVRVTALYCPACATRIAVPQEGAA